MACKDPKIESACRRPSCVYPGICENLNTDHNPLIRLYRKARALPGVKKVLIGSGLRYGMMFKLIPERTEYQDYVARIAQRPALQRAQEKDKELSAQAA